MYPAPMAGPFQRLREENIDLALLTMGILILVNSNFFVTSSEASWLIILSIPFGSY